MTDLTIKELRSEWVEFASTFSGRGEARKYEEMFDRCLAQHDAEVARQALEEGGLTDRIRYPTSRRPTDRHDRGADDVRRWHGSGLSGTRHTWRLIVEARPALGWRWSTYQPGELVPTYRYARSRMGHTWTRRGAYRAARRDIHREMRRDRRLTARDAARIHEEVAA